jgi:hypothetical protein
VANRIVLEEDKPKYAKWYYLDLGAYGLSMDKSIENAPKPKPYEEHMAIEQDAR